MIQKQDLVAIAGLTWTVGIPAVTLVVWMRRRRRDLESGAGTGADGRLPAERVLAGSAVATGVVGAALLWLTASWLFSGFFGWWGGWADAGESSVWGANFAGTAGALGFGATSLAFALGWLSLSRGSRRGSRSRLGFAAMTLASLGALAVATMGAGFLTAAWQDDRGPEQATARAYASRYVELVNSGDVDGLQALLADAGAPQDAAKRIALYRRIGLHDFHVVAVKDDENFSEFYAATIAATTRAGQTVTMRELVEYTSDPFPGARFWHWSMYPLERPVSELAGIWREPSAAGHHVMRVRHLGGYRSTTFLVTYSRLSGSPRKFFVAGATGMPQEMIRYVAGHPSGAPDVILYDYLLDTLTITTAGGRSHSLVRADHP